MTNKIVLVEVHELEGDLLLEHGRKYRYFGISSRVEYSFFSMMLGMNPKELWKSRFYATVEGSCYEFDDGEHMSNTSDAFREFLKEKRIEKEEDRYISLLERAKKL